MSPLPSKAELEAYYRHNYKEHKSPGAVSHEFRFSEKNKEHVYRDYSLSLADIELAPKDLIGNSILDFGCANGFFLDYCNSIGCSQQDLRGYDIAQDLIQEVQNKGYFVGEPKAASCDFVFLWDVLEHVIDPDSLISNIRMYLKTNGKLVIQTPQTGHFSTFLREDWEHFLPFEHVILYSRKALVRLLEDHGFALTTIRSFGANAPANLVSEPYKSAYDRLAKIADQGCTQIGLFALTTLTT